MTEEPVRYKAIDVALSKAALIEMAKHYLEPELANAKAAHKPDYDKLLAGVDEAIVFYQQSRRQTAVRAEIEGVYKAANAAQRPNAGLRQARNLSNRIALLSKAAAHILGRRRFKFILKVTLPTAAEIENTDVNQRRIAIDRVLSIVATGRKSCEGRRRSSGRRSVEIRPELYAPNVGLGQPSKAAERELVMHLRLAHFDATGVPPLATSKQAENLRTGFAMFVDFVFQELGIKANAVNAINATAPVTNKKKIPDLSSTN